MLTPDPSSPTTLVLGYGNPLRADDGAGSWVAEAVAALALPGVEARAVHQLTPELAGPIAAAELVVFVDARVESPGMRGGAEATWRADLIPETAAAPSSLLGHHGDPAALLALAQSVYGRRPAAAWLVTLPATDLGFGESLSPPTRRAAVCALDWILSIVLGHLSLVLCPWSLVYDPWFMV